MKTFYQQGNKDLENPNILIDLDNKSIELQPYTDELCLKFIKLLLELIQLKFDDDFSVDLGCDHNFDGLRETNVALLKSGGGGTWINGFHYYSTFWIEDFPLGITEF